MPPPTLRSVSSSTTSSVRTSRRSSFPAPLTGSPARPSSTRTLRTSKRATSRMRMMRMRTSSATIVMRMRSQMMRYVLTVSPLCIQYTNMSCRTMAQNPSKRLLSASRVKCFPQGYVFHELEVIGPVFSDLDAGIRVHFGGFVAASSLVLTCSPDDPLLQTLHYMFFVPA